MNTKRHKIDVELRVYKGRSVRKIPWPKIQPLGFAFMEGIYLRDSHWEDFLTGNPNPKTLSILSHEHTHTERMGKSVKTHVVFWLKRDFRFNEELVSIRNEMEVLKEHGEDFDIDERARNLSGLVYLWCTNYDTAYRELEKIWKSK